MGSAAHEWSGEVEDLDPAAILVALAGTETRTRQAELDTLVLGLQWCAVNPPGVDTGVATWGGSTSLAGVFDDEESVGGQGTAAVCALAAESVATVLGVSTHSGMQLIADALDLAHRLPLVWARVQTLGVPVWRARKAAEATHWLSQEAAAFLDEQLVGGINSVGVGTVKRLAAEAAARFEPAASQTAEGQGIADSGVELWDRLGFGYACASELHATGDTVDLTRFHDYLNELAAGVAAAGDTTPWGCARSGRYGRLPAAMMSFAVPTLSPRPRVAPATIAPGPG